MSVLIWVQTVCKGYQQKTKVAADKEKFCLLKTGTCCVQVLQLIINCMHTTCEELKIILKSSWTSSGTVLGHSKTLS